MAKGTLVFRGETYEKQPSGLSGATEPMMWPKGQGAKLVANEDVEVVLMSDGW